MAETKRNTNIMMRMMIKKNAYLEVIVVPITVNEVSESYLNMMVS